MENFKRSDASKQASSLSERSEAASKHATAAELQFALAVGPLEAKAHRRLTGPGRAACRSAFEEAPEAFEQLAADALRRGRNPLGLLCCMVQEGDHLLGEARELSPGERLELRTQVREARDAERGSAAVTEDDVRNQQLAALEAAIAAANGDHPFAVRRAEELRRELEHDETTA